MNVTVSPGSIFTSAGSKTITPSVPLSSIFTSISAAPAAPASRSAADAPINKALISILLWLRLSGFC